VKWNNLHLSIRVDVPIEQIVAFVYLGADLNRFTPAGTSSASTLGGGHVGGGILSQIDPELWFRAEMKFHANPGTSMYFGLGFMIR